VTAIEEKCGVVSNSVAKAFPIGRTAGAKDKGTVCDPVLGRIAVFRLWIRPSCSARLEDAVAPAANKPHLLPTNRFWSPR
jgi:hypothetical protein